MELAINYTTQIWREGDQFIAHSMPLDVASSGTSPDEARKALGEAVRLFLSTAAEHGTLDPVLEDSGYVRTAHSWQSPSWLAIERGNWEDFDRIMARVPDVPPVTGDER